MGGTYMVRSAVLVQWLTLLTLGLAAPALACPVCGIGQDGTTSAYLITAVLMSTIPLMMLGVIVYYLVRRVHHSPGEAHENRR
jgi:hypothetical protein